MIANVVLLYPFILVLFSTIIGRVKVSKFLNFLIGLIVIFITHIIIKEAVEYINPGDYKVYLKVFEACASVKSCFNYSPFESGFNFFVGFLREYLNLSAFEVWSTINITNLVLITLISNSLSNYFRKQYKFLSIQTFIIAFTFPSFLLVSIRAGLAFSIISCLLIEVIKNNDKGIKFFFNYKNVCIVLLSITIHIQSILLIILLITFLLIKENYIINSDTNFLTKLQKGFISKKLILILFAIFSLITICYLNFNIILPFLGKNYYHFGLRSERSLGIRSLTDQIIIITIITPLIFNSDFYKNNIVFRKFFKLFVFFQFGTITLYYLTLFIIGIDGFARQCQYNYLTFLLIYMILNKKFSILRSLPILYSIFYIYYTFASDTNFKILEFNLL